MTFFKIKRIYHSIRLLLCRTYKKRADYIKKHNLLGEIGENCYWGPWKLPLYPKLIKLHNNVYVHKNASLICHDKLDSFLQKCKPEYDFGPGEKIGCIELMDNVYVCTKSIIMPDVRINNNCIISTGSVVTSDIPENSIVSGVPAEVVGRFDMFMSLRRMSAKNNPKISKFNIPQDVEINVWNQFNKKRGSL